jgi:hypothetical protein
LWYAELLTSRPGRDDLVVDWLVTKLNGPVHTTAKQGERYRAKPADLSTIKPIKLMPLAWLDLAIGAKQLELIG